MGQKTYKYISNGLRIKIDNITDIKATIHEDNQAAISNAKRCSINIQTRHIHTKYWHLREHLGKDKGIMIQYIDSSENIGDIFTKGTKPELLILLCNKLIVIEG